MEENKNKINDLYALIGKDISYSFSKKYFTEKFEKEQILNAKYVNFDIKSINELVDLLHFYPNLKGLNVTIPYKETIFSFLNSIDPIAQEIGAVNTIKIEKNKILKGYNTDYYGFTKAIKPLLKPHHKSALILGTGGASKAIAYALKQLNITFKHVSRYPKENQISYDTLPYEIQKHYLIINCTPLGTFPNINNCISIPYNKITKKHFLFDLIYNPTETLFLRHGKEMGATICNGYQMLIEQAEKSWEIWNNL